MRARTLVTHTRLAAARQRAILSRRYTPRRSTVHRQWKDSVSWHYSTASRQKNEQI